MLMLIAEEMRRMGGPAFPCRKRLPLSCSRPSSPSQSRLGLLSVRSSLLVPRYSLFSSLPAALHIGLNVSVMVKLAESYQTQYLDLAWSHLQGSNGLSVMRVPSCRHLLPTPLLLISSMLWQAGAQMLVLEANSRWTI
jgi:hypothetical protein